MSKYTTGELAKLTGVSVRTVQYYDNRGILVPSELSEGGRRLYNEGDLKRMKIICFLREAGLPINSIAALLSEEKPESIISLLLKQQEDVLREELSERQKRLELLEGIRREISELESFSVESIGDIAHVMKEKKQAKQNALDNDSYGYPRKPASNCVHSTVDYKRPMVALCNLGRGSRCMGMCHVGLLFRTRCLYLPRVSRGIQPTLQGSVLCLSHTENASLELPLLQPSRTLR